MDNSTQADTDTQLKGFIMQTSHHSLSPGKNNIPSKTVAAFRLSRRLMIPALALAVLTLVALNQHLFPTADAQTGQSSNLKSDIVEMLSQMPMSFEANHGQTSSEVKYLSRGRGYTMFLTADEAVMRLEKSAGNTADRPGEIGKKVISDVLRMKLIGASRSAQISAAEALPTKVSYLTGNDRRQWRETALYEKVKYTGVYPGIDLIWYGNQRMLEYDFVVAPGSSYKNIRLAFAGQQKLSLAENGDLIITLDGGEVRQPKPFIYQQRDGERQQIAGHFVIETGNEVSFDVAAYDERLPLVIDPNLTYATYLGGPGDDIGWGIAVDAAGMIYITGETASTEFPVINEYQSTNSGSKDVFVSKINPALGATTPLLALVWSSYLGGNDNDIGKGIAVNSSGQVFIVGNTASTDFPTLNQYQSDQGGTDVFVARLDTTQTGAAALLCSTYLGDGGEDFGSAIAIDSANNAYVTGRTLSTTFPTLNELQLNQSVQDAFATKLSLPTSGSSTVAYSTYLGGSGSDEGRGIAVDSAGVTYVTGITLSADYPRKNEYQADQPFSDVFVTKLDPTQSGNASLLWSSYVGGESDDESHAIAVDNAGIAYIAGRSESVSYPLKNQYAAKQEGSDAIVTKLDTTKTGADCLVWSSYIGGSDFDTAESIAIDTAGNAYIAGFTQSADFPLKDQSQGHPGDTFFNAFVSKLDTTKTGTAALSYSTYYGASGEDKGLGIAIDSIGNAFITGSTLSFDLPLITPYQTSQSDMEVFIARLSPPGFSAPPTIIAGAPVTRQQGSPAGAAVTIANVDDDVTPRGNLTVEVMTTPAGISITGITNTNGTVAANVAASCTATIGLNIVVLKVTDGGGMTATTNFNVTVTENTAPALGNYPSTTVAGGGTVTSTPDAVPSDNGSIVELKAVAVESSFNGTLTVNPTTGVVTVTNAGIGGTYNINVSAKDNCDLITVRSFVLTVSPACSFSLPSNSKVVGPAAASYIANVTATAGCRWTSVSNDPWISITAGANSTGSGTFTFAVTANTAGTRSGTITVAGFTYTVTQTTNDLSVDSDSDGVPDAIEPDEGLNYLIKDNDVFTNNRLFAMQQYRDFFMLEGDSAGITFWTDLLANATLSRSQVIEGFYNSSDFQSRVPPVIRLYQVGLGRIPDFAGLWHQVKAIVFDGVPLRVIAQNIVTSPEFEARYGILTDSQYITLLYNNAFGRDPLPQELIDWQNYINSGASRGDVLIGFTESDNYLRESSDRVFITSMYIAMVRREPQPQELTDWLSFFQNGIGRLVLIQSLLEADGYHVRFLP
jgi:hypothetical protein